MVSLKKGFPPFLSSQVWVLRLPPTPSTATNLVSPSTKCDRPPHPRCPRTCSPTARRCPSLCTTSHPSSPPLLHNPLPDSWTFPPTSRSRCSPFLPDRRIALSRRHRHTATTPSSETPASVTLWPAEGERTPFGSVYADYKETNVKWAWTGLQILVWCHCAHSKRINLGLDVCVCLETHQLLYNLNSWRKANSLTHTHTHTHSGAL